MSSAKMQPMDQISTALVYSEALRMTSGALYQRVTTYLTDSLASKKRRKRSLLGFELVFGFEAAGETEIADLEVTVLVEEQV